MKNVKINFDFHGKKKAKKNLKKGLAIGAALGTVVGAVAGILTAPKSGKETREEIKNGVIDASGKVVETAKEVAAKTVTMIKEKIKKDNDVAEEVVFDDVIDEVKDTESKESNE
ncbi:YtxH-like protein [Caloramator mitchellensis]|uniref:YtxH-like protein n=1 Tax=Caloramator mitchellensis TaxID=908809 RepID=A0A0R3JRT6_CALMK|nr:YtxH domain-containing protein [Caloramator mitchellensis]KRQ86192.1 YtxH-like protein [Caloramator mitchellensis]